MADVAAFGRGECGGQMDGVSMSRSERTRGQRVFWVWLAKMGAGGGGVGQ